METGSLYIEGHREARKRIIQGALTRFAPFGIKETTVQEIAKDAGVRTFFLKALFRDGTDPVTRATMQTIRQQQEDVPQLLQGRTAVLQKTYRWLEIQDRTRRTYGITRILYAGVPDDVIVLIKSNEIGQICALLRDGIEDGGLSECHVELISKLFAEILHGLVAPSCTKPSKLHLNRSCLSDEILEKQKEITGVFINGLRSPINSYDR